MTSTGGSRALRNLRTVDDDDRPDDNKFQVQLKKLEGSHPKIRVFAVGGNTDGQLPNLNDVGQRIGRAFMQHALGRRDHDWVVGVKSSMPVTWSQEDQLETTCNHFRYFQPEQDGVLTYVARLLEKALGVGPARDKSAISTAGSAEPQTRGPAPEAGSEGTETTSSPAQGNSVSPIVSAEEDARASGVRRRGAAHRQGQSGLRRT